MSNLTDFLLTLGARPEQSRLFRQNPTFAMQQAGLNDTEMAVLTSQNLEQIQTATSYGVWDKLIAKGVIVLDPESENTTDDRD